MRIAYITDIDLNAHSGVRLKHVMQCGNWEKLGHEVVIFSMPNTEQVNISKVDIPIKHKIFDNKIASYFGGGFKAYCRKILSIPSVLRALRDYNPDFVYLRSMIYFPGLIRILNAYPTFIEYNTLVEEELKMVSSFKTRLMHGMGYEHLNKSARGFIGVTNEITQYYRDKYAKPSIAIGNGFDLNSYPDQTLKSKNQRPQLVFVGSPDMPWQGVDKFYQMSQRIEADFHLVGPSISDSLGCKDNFFQHGYLQKNLLDALYLKMDIAVGSLALHRKKMSEATPLKVREYCAYGLPIILAYNDTDLSGQEFVLEIDNTEDTIDKNIQRIKDFIQKWHNRRVPRQNVIPLIDYSVKERIRLNFIKDVLDNNGV
ncbi:glycosyltransferase [Chitinophaga sp. MM2321]|uniref:glycosyltransferase n=1 Tax=Chitinophaga sp. MM2321 TaxID=3137178 RepID=UPI0032D5767F